MQSPDLFTTNGESTHLFSEEFYRDLTFTKLDASGNRFARKEFYNCKFVQCSFYKTVFSSCEFEDCTFEKCDLSLAVVQSNKFVDVMFRNCKIVGVDWAGLRSPSRFNFEDSILKNNIFLKMNLNGMHFNACNLQDSDFSESNLTKVVFAGCDLTGAKFQMSNLALADFSESFNYQINLNNVKVKKTIFTLPEAASLLQSFDIVLK